MLWAEREMLLQQNSQKNKISLVLKMEAEGMGPGVKECGKFLEARKVKKTDYHLELPERIALLTS